MEEMINESYNETKVHNLLERILEVELETISQLHLVDIFMQRNWIGSMHFSGQFY